MQLQQGESTVDSLLIYAKLCVGHLWITWIRILCRISVTNTCICLHFVSETDRLESVCVAAIL